ncbi:hypothetical protein MCY_00064 [Bartonella rattimassiliensis 15908]|uniref:Uncharacterized protein n=1 Tax=Bartonella rattimassiliensis 15908 TaxID=1094556 RepID=J0ZHV4_9HYPH|nr:hypothetical protein MCY_00064 [Bartonella rattimassiliensis 15908]
MTAFLIIGMFIVVGIALFISLAFCMVLFSTITTILALYYSLIKRAILLFKMRQKLKKSATQNLRHDQTENRKQNDVLQFSPLSFQEALILSRKDYSIISSIAFVIFVLCVGFIVFSAFLPKSKMFLLSHAPILFYISDFVMRMMFLGWACIVVALPVILIFHGIFHYDIKSITKKLKTLA